MDGNREAAENTLWSKLAAMQGQPFKTAKGLDFTYKIKGNELFVDRKSKSITRATVMLTYKKAMELGGIVTGPKKLGTFGASYLYPIFMEIGLIRCQQAQLEGQQCLEQDE